MTANARQVNGGLVRALSDTFNDHWSQPRLFINSLSPAEQQILVNAIRFETSHIKSTVVRENVIIQLNRISNDIAVRVAQALNIVAPAPDPTFYHDNKTAGVNIFGVPLNTVATLSVGVLATTSDQASMQQALELKNRFARDGVVVTTIGESLAQGVDLTYSSADASTLDGIVVAAGAEPLFAPGSASTLFPLGRPGQILLDGYRWGKPVGGVGGGADALAPAGVPAATPGVFSEADVESFVTAFEGGLMTFKFVDRFPLDAPVIGNTPGAPAPPPAEAAPADPAVPAPPPA